MLNLHTQRHWRKRALAISVVMLAALAACGGGHDEDDAVTPPPVTPPPVTPPPVTQPHYVSFVQGNPGLPGDGATISVESPWVFDLSTPIRLSAAPDGFTISVFVPRGSPAPDFIELFIGNRLTLNQPCFAYTGDGPVPTRKVEVNGAAGLVMLYTPARITYIVGELNAARRPGCPLMSASDLWISGIRAVRSDTLNMTYISTLDAVAIDAGLMTAP